MSSGEFPTVPLKRVCDPERAISYGIVQPGKPVAHGVPIVRVNNFANGDLDLSDPLLVAPELDAQFARSRPRRNDVLVTLVGSIGQLAIAPRNIEGWNLARAVGLVPMPNEQQAQWTYFALSAPPAQRFIQERANTTVQATFNLRDLAELPIPFPDEGDRQAVLSVLSPLKRKIELNRRMSETLEAMAQAIFRDWFVDFGPVHRKLAGERDPVAIMGGLVSDAKRAAQVAALFPESMSQEELPEHWEQVSIGEVASVSGGKQLHKSKISDEGTIPVFGGAGHMGFTDEANADGFVITVGRVGAYCGRFVAYNGPAWVNNNASRVTPNPDTPAEWLLLSLRALDMDTMRRGAAQPFVSNGDLLAQLVVRSDDAVLKAFTEFVAPLYRRMEVADAESVSLTQARDYLLPRLMSGKVRVADVAEAAP